VINKGTAAEAKAWGFANGNGKAFAGKTGTSRDGWFAGFTPELVCVVYVGFDDGDDLGMKGSDSAMPIWADFMKEALDVHPEWNGDWEMPASVRKAEIDTRSGKLIRELSNDEADSVKAQQDAMKKNSNSNLQMTPIQQKEIYLTDVPSEYRRIELFVSGTVPNRSLLPVDENSIGDPSNNPNATPTPFTTWEEEQQNSNRSPRSSSREAAPVELEQKITVAICPLTGMRATRNCPNRENKTFKPGEEPKEFCTFHVGK
jgi:membrane peptidoglycan carboxypeptidase